MPDLTFPLTLNGMPYRWLKEGSGEQSFGAFGADGVAKERYLINWEDRFNFRAALLGDAFQDAGGNVTITPGHQHPAYPDLFGVGCDIKPRGKPVGTTGGKWQWAECSVTYKIPPFPGGGINPLDLMDEEIEDASEILPTDGGNWVVDDPAAGSLQGVGLTAPVNKVLPHLNYIITMYQVMTLPKGLVSYYGTCNNATFKGFDPFTVVYQGFKAQRKISIGNSIRWTVRHAFLISPLDVRKEFFGKKFLIVKIPGGGASGGDEYKFNPANYASIGVGT